MPPLMPESRVYALFASLSARTGVACEPPVDRKRPFSNGLKEVVNRIEIKRRAALGGHPLRPTDAGVMSLAAAVVQYLAPALGHVVMQVDFRPGRTASLALLVLAVGCSTNSSSNPLIFCARSSLQRALGWK